MNLKFDLWLDWLRRLGGTYEFYRPEEEKGKPHDPPEHPTRREAKGYELEDMGWKKIQTQPLQL